MATQAEKGTAFRALHERPGTFVIGIRDSSIYVAGLSADAAGAVFFLLVLMLMPALPLVRSAMPSRFFVASSRS